MSERQDAPGGVTLQKRKVAAVWNRAMRSLGYTRRGRWFVLPRRTKKGRVR